MFRKLSAKPIIRSMDGSRENIVGRAIELHWILIMHAPGLSLEMLY